MDPSGAAAQQRQLDHKAAREYERLLVPVVFQPWAEDLVGRARLERGACVLDLACGTGIVAALAAGRVGNGGSIYGVDVNQHMLDLAWLLSEQVPIDWRLGNAEHLPFDVASFDVAFCQQGLQFFNDRECALREIARVLRPGGRVLASVWGDGGGNPWLAAAVAAFEAIGQPEVAVSFRKTLDLADQRQLGTLLAGAGFERICVETTCIELAALDAEDFVCGSLAALPFAGQITDHGRCVHDILIHLQPYMRGRGLVFPSTAHVASAAKGEF